MLSPKSELANDHSITGDWFKKKSLNASLRMIKIVSKHLQDETWYKAQINHLLSSFRFYTSEHGEWLAEMANKSTTADLVKV